MIAAPFDTYVASHDGHSLRIAARMLARLALPEGGAQRLSATPPAIDPARPVLLVAAVRYGNHLPEARAFLDAYAALPSPPPLALASVNLTARKPERQTAEESAYLKKSIKAHNLQPVAARAFGGKLDYPKYAFFDRQIIRLIMWITGGPTDGTSVVEYTDWDDVDRFAESLPAAFGVDQPAPAG
jgi:menaquinone-dependent protoporphyrinogen oxidase